MLAEFVEYILTPCPPVARKLGLLKEAVAIRARFGRCRKAWQEHLQNCHSFILDVSRNCPRRKTALILGSGALLDIPIEALASSFDQVVLADLVHPLNARWRTRTLRNVRLETRDLTGTLDQAANGRLPSRTPINFYQDHPLGPPELPILPDLVVSANILSQLALLPVKYLAVTKGHSQEGLEAYAKSLAEEHLAWLTHFSGSVCLITDTASFLASQRQDLLPGISLPEPSRTWTWNIAPRPEAHPHHDLTHSVAGIVLSQRS